MEVTSRGDVTLSWRRNFLFQTKTLRVTGRAALSIATLISFFVAEQKSLKKAKTIINQVMLNHPRTIKMFCGAMSTPV